MESDRFPALPFAALTKEQREAAEAIARGPRGALYGPFVPLLRSPELMDCAQRMGEYLRYRSAIGTRLSELVILVIARFWTQQVEWAIHAPIAADVGIASETIDAIAAGRRPEGMSADEATVYEFSVELCVNRGVCDTTFHRALERFGEHGVIDLLGLNGYYTFLSMLMNGARTAAPATTVPPLEPLAG